MNESVGPIWAALARNPQGVLTDAMRKSVYSLFGPLSSDEVWATHGRSKYLLCRRPSAGQHRRANLAMCAAERALSIWTQRFPHDRRPVELIAAVPKVLRGADVEAAFASKSLFDASTDRLLAEGADFDRDVAAGLAASAALSVALVDEPLMVADEVDLDMDAALLSSIACEANGAMPKREFWEWWLKEAERALASE